MFCRVCTVNKLSDHWVKSTTTLLLRKPKVTQINNITICFELKLVCQYFYPVLCFVCAYSHGTCCAGEISAKLDNGVCVVGVAYGYKISGIVKKNDFPFYSSIQNIAIECNKMKLIKLPS